MDFALLGICYDKTQTFRKGAAKGPDTLRRIFPKLETFLNGVDLTERAFVEDLGNVTAQDRGKMISDTVAKLSQTSKFPIVLGGEHTVSIGVAKAAKPVNIVVLDAHPDCEDSEAHNGVVRKMAELPAVKQILLYGIRCISKVEHGYLQKSKKVRMVNSLDEIRKLKGPTFLSIDMDVLDPALLQAVGNPEPDGLTFGQVMAVVKALAKSLVAIDFVEYTPIMQGGSDVNHLIAGKLIYSSMAEIVKARK